MRITENMKSGHFYEGFTITHATPLYMFVCFAWFLKIIHWVIPQNVLARFGFTLQD